MRAYAKNILFRLLPASIAFPVVLAAAPLCTDCPTLKPAATNAHACCEKIPKLKAPAVAECAGCAVQSAPQVRDEFKADFSPVESQVAYVRSDLSLKSVKFVISVNFYRPPVPPGAAFITQHKLLV